MMVGFQLKRALKIGVKSLWLHRMRSLLTALGIMLGVCSVIAMLAIGTGASQEAQEQIQRLGSLNIIIQSVKPPQSDQASESQSMLSQYGLTEVDHQIIQETLPGVARTVPSRRVPSTVMRENRRLDTNIIGTTPDYLSVNNVSLQKGRFLSESDMENKAAVCVLGRGTEQTLFPMGGAVGGVVRSARLRFRVVGTISSLPRGEFAGQKLDGDPNLGVYIPLTTMRNYFGRNIIHRTSGSETAERVELHELTVQVRDLDEVRPAERVIRHVLGQLHREQDYLIVVPLHLLVQARETARIWSFVLGSIAAISLLVGGIGIMNITLATVVERTREIGVRRAMGAKRRHIVFQFLTETLLLALFGGGIGIALGIAGPWAVEKFADMRTTVTLWSLGLAFGISAAVGVAFGIYPAYRAANMDPIEALRHE
jgi:putative ABC transport system permease protein